MRLEEVSLMALQAVTFAYRGMLELKSRVKLAGRKRVMLAIPEKLAMPVRFEFRNWVRWTKSVLFMVRFIVLVMLARCDEFLMRSSWREISDKWAACSAVGTSELLQPWKLAEKVNYTVATLSWRYEISYLDSGFNGTNGTIRNEYRLAFLASGQVAGNVTGLDDHKRLDHTLSIEITLEGNILQVFGLEAGVTASIEKGLAFSKIASQSQIAKMIPLVILQRIAGPIGRWGLGNKS